MYSLYTLTLMSKIVELKAEYDLKQRCRKKVLYHGPPMITYYIIKHTNTSN